MATINPSSTNASSMEACLTREINPNMDSVLNTDLVLRGLSLFPIMSSSGCDDLFLKGFLDWIASPRWRRFFWIIMGFFFRFFIFWTCLWGCIRFWYNRWTRRFWNFYGMFSYLYRLWYVFWYLYLHKTFNLLWHFIIRLFVIKSDLYWFFYHTSSELYTLYAFDLSK